MRKLILVSALIAMIGCKKDPPLEVSGPPTGSATTIPTTFDFAGLWTTPSMCGTPHEVLIQEGFNDSTIFLYGGAVVALTDSNTFESGAVSSVVHSGFIQGDTLLYYCQSSGGSECCGWYTK